MKAPQSESKAVVFSGSVYRLLLAAYPRAHREEYGGPMAQLFLDQCRDAWKRRRIWGVVWLWLRVLPDLVKTAIWERLINRGERKYMFRKFFAGMRSRPALLGVFMGVSFAVFLLCLISSTIFTFILPETYSSRARIKLERIWIVTPGGVAQPSATGSKDPYTMQSEYERIRSEKILDFVHTELEVIQSEKILDGVIDALDLNTAWAVKFNSPTKLNYSESRSLLKKMIEVRPARNTRLIDITVYSDDKAEAARIANCIAEVYQTYRQNQFKELSAGSLGKYQQLKDELKSELADKTNDPKAVDAKITETIAEAGELYQTMKAGVPSGSVEIIEHAEPGFRPVRPNKPPNIFLGGAIGGIVGMLVGGVVVVIIAGMLPRRTATA